MKGTDWSVAYQGTLNGYKIVPVRADGVPCFSGIYDDEIEYYDTDIEQWEVPYSQANLGVVCGPKNVAVIDVDVDDAIVNQRLYRFIASYLPSHVLRRRTGSPRFAVIVRADADARWISKATSHAYRNPLTGKQQVVEYLGKRKYLFVSGIHRKDLQSEYEMPVGRSVIDTPVSSLSYLTEDILDKIFSMFKTLALKGWAKVSGPKKTGVRPKGGTPPPTDGGKPRVITISDDNDWRNSSLGVKTVWDTVELERSPYTEEEIQFILDNSDGSERDSWLRVGMALHKHYNGSEEGLIRWDTWSKEFRGYAGFPDQQYNWSKFHTDGPMSLRSLERKIKQKQKLREVYQEAREAVIPELLDHTPKRGEEALDFMMQHYVLIANGAQVGDLSKPVAESIRILGHMREFTRNRKVQVEETTTGGRVVNKMVPCFDMWLHHNNHFEAWDTTYMPGGNRLVERKGLVYYNTYNPPEVARVEGSAYLRYFLEHLAYLFPRGGDAWMINWMAQLVQDPAHRYRVAPFSISVFEGTGRGWLTRLLSKLVGYSNYATVKDIGDIIRPGAKSGYLDGTVLLVFNEVFTTGKLRFQVLSQVKTILSDDIQEIDVKYGKHTYNQQIYTRCFFQSNHINGLIIEDNDSRIQPFINREKPKPQEYYTHLYKLLEREQFVNEVYSFLMRQAVNTDMLTHSQHTEDREMVIRGTKSSTALAFYEFRNIVGVNGVFSDEMLTDFVNDYIHVLNEDGGEDGSAFVNMKELRMHKSKNLTGSRPIKYRGRRIMVRAFSPVIDSPEDVLVKRFEESRNELDNFMVEFANRIQRIKESTNE